MSVALTLTGKRPNNTQFGLDSFTEIYKCDATADIVLTDPSVPQMGAPHDDYPFMFVVSRYCNESGESASALDLTYTGCLLDDGEGGPLLPPQKQTSTGQVASGTTNTDANIYPSLTTNPLTLNFYAITNTLSFLSTDPADASEPDDPPEVVAENVITWDFGFGVQPGLAYPDLIPYLLTVAFTQAIIEPPPDIEPVVMSIATLPNAIFYQITKKKTRTLLPYAPAS